MISPVALTMEKMRAAMRHLGTYGIAKDRPGDIVRWHDKWGVCVKPKFESVPMFAWFDEDGEFLKEISTTDKDVSAPFDWSYPGIPESVLIRATVERLTA